MIEIFKLMQGLVRIGKKTCFELQNLSTKGHHLKLKQKYSRLDIRKYSFSKRVVNDWNYLSEEVVSAPSIENFQRKLDHYWKASTFDLP